MSTQTEEILRICEALPEGKRTEVADFAKFLLDKEMISQISRRVRDECDARRENFASR